MADRKKKQKKMVEKKLDPESADFKKQRDDILRDIAMLDVEDPTNKHSLLCLYSPSDPDVGQDFITPSTPGVEFFLGGSSSGSGPAAAKKEGSSYGFWFEDGKLLELDNKDKLKYAKERIRMVGLNVKKAPSKAQGSSGNPKGAPHK